MTLAQLTLMAVMLLYQARSYDANSMGDEASASQNFRKSALCAAGLLFLAIWRLTS